MSDRTGQLANRVALVTGAAHGIGEAIAARFAAEGAQVVIADIDADDARMTAEKIRSDGGTAIGLGVDVSNASAVARAVGAAVDAFGPVDLLVNNAGDVTLQRHFLTSDEAWWDHFLNANLKASTCAAARSPR